MNMSERHILIVGLEDEADIDSIVSAIGMMKGVKKCLLKIEPVHETIALDEITLSQISGYEALARAIFGVRILSIDDITTFRYVAENALRGFRLQENVDLVRRRFGLPPNKESEKLKNIAADFGVSTSRITQKINVVLRHLRHPINSRRLRQTINLDDYDDLT